MQKAVETRPAEIRPRLRNDVVFLRVDTGIYLRSSETSCVLKGRGAYEWMSILGPRMTGVSTMAELCEGLDEGRRKTALALMRTLLDRGFARHVPLSGDDVLPQAVREHFRPQINFVEHFTHEDPRTPEELFAGFRDSRVLVSGDPGPLTEAAVRGLLRNGLAEVTLDDAGWGTAFDEETDRATRAGAPARVTVLSGTPADLTAFDVVVYACDSTSSRALLELTERLRATPDGPRLVPVVTDSARVVIGPVSGPAEQPCWLCAQLRLAANSDPRLSADFWRGLAIGPVGTPAAGTSGTVPGMVGNAVAFEVFRLRTGQLRPDDERHAVVQDLTTLESHRERVLPHPGCVLRHTPADTAEAGAPADDKDAYGRAAVLVSPDFGVMSGWADESVQQIPLKTGRVRLGAVGSPAGPDRLISAFDTDTTLAARTRAVLAGASCYVGRLGPTATAAPEGARRIAADSLELYSGLPATTETGPLLTALSLPAQEVWLVPAGAVHPLSPANKGLRFEPSAAGAAAGWTIAEVQERGLCSALARRGLDRALSRRAPAVALSEEWLAGDDEVSFVLGSLRHIGHRVRVLALPGAAPAFAVLAVTEAADGGPADWAVGSALSVRDAVREAVRDAVGLAMSRHRDGTPADPGDSLYGDLEPRALAEGDAKADWSYHQPAVPLAEALDALDAEGTRVLFADTTTIDLRAVGAMVTGTVLLAAQ